MLVDLHRHQCRRVRHLHRCLDGEKMRGEPFTEIMMALCFYWGLFYRGARLAPEILLRIEGGVGGGGSSSAPLEDLLKFSCE